MTLEELLTTKFSAEMKARHTACLSDPVYLAGFSSERNENPYVFETDLDLARMKISLKEGPLTEDEKTRLREMNAEIDATPWHRWSSGHHARCYDFLANDEHVHHYQRERTSITGLGL